FEFASPDLRALDFAVGIWSFGVALWQTDRDWTTIEAFAAGYGDGGALQHLEVAALPALLRLREAVSLTHWVGRQRQGLTTEADIVERAERMLRIDHWLQTHADELVQRVEQAML